MAISPNGDHIVSSSHDKSLRLWERTREPIILEEEREMVRQQPRGFEMGLDRHGVGELNYLFVFDRNERRSLRRAWPKRICLW